MPSNYVAPWPNVRFHYVDMRGVVTPEGKEQYPMLRLISAETSKQIQEAADTILSTSPQSLRKEISLDRQLAAIRWPEVTTAIERYWQTKFVKQYESLQRELQRLLPELLRQRKVPKLLEDTLFKAIGPPDGSVCHRAYDALLSKTRQAILRRPVLYRVLRRRQSCQSYPRIL